MDSIPFRVAAGVRISRGALMLFSIGGLAFFSHPQPARVLLGVVIIAVFLLIPLGLTWVTPSFVDREALGMRFGRRFPWKELRDVKVIAQRRGASVVNYRFVFTFPKGSARFGLNQTANGREVIAFIEKTLSRALLPHG